MEEDDQSVSEYIIWPAEVVRQLALVFGTTTTGMVAILGMSRHQVWRQIHHKKMLSAIDQQRVRGAIRLYAVVLKLCGYATAEQRIWARRWMHDWLRTPSPFFDGQSPLSQMSQSNGPYRLATYLSRLRYGVYS